MKIAVLTKSLDNSQLSYSLITQLNFLAGKGHPDLIDIVVFYETLAMPCVPPKFALMQTAEGYGYDGAIIATDLNCAKRALILPSAKKKFFYVWDLEWLRPKQFPYRYFADVYRHPDLKLLARSDEHAEVIKNCWNVDVDVLPDFNNKKLLEIVCG